MSGLRLQMWTLLLIIISGILISFKILIIKLLLIKA
jgi:hypothetical protein